MTWIHDRARLLREVLRQQIINAAEQGELCTYAGTDAGDERAYEALTHAGYTSSTPVVVGRRAIQRALRYLIKFGVIERRRIPTSTGPTYKGDARWCYDYRPKVRP